MEKDFNGSQPCIGHAKRSLPPNGFNVWKATIDANGMAMDFGDTSVGLSGMAMHGIGFHWEPTIAQTTHCLVPKNPLGLQLGNICN